MTEELIYPKNSFLIRLDENIQVEPMYRSEFSIAINTDKRIFYVADDVDTYIVERSVENLRSIGEDIIRLDSTCNRKDVFTLKRYIGYPFSDAIQGMDSIIKFEPIVKVEPIKLTFFIIGLSKSCDLMNQLSNFDSYEIFMNTLVNNITKKIDLDYHNAYIDWYNDNYDFRSLYEFMCHFDMKESISDGINYTKIDLQSTFKDESMIPINTCCLIIRWDELN